MVRFRRIYDHQYEQTHSIDPRPLFSKRVVVVPTRTRTKLVRDRVRVQGRRQEFDFVWGWVRHVVDEREGREWSSVWFD